LSADLSEARHGLTVKVVLFGKLRACGFTPEVATGDVHERLGT
jgi:hypothetical protein